MTNEDRMKKAIITPSATLKELVEKRQQEQDLCVVVLDRYKSSPYSYPANEYKNVDGQSTLKGSWVSARCEKNLTENDMYILGKISGVATKYKIPSDAAIRIYKRAYFYGFPFKELFKKYSEQKGNCKICGEFYGIKLQVDHCHASGKFRGFLCNDCNSRLGAYEKLLPHLPNVLRYLS